MSTRENIRLIARAPYVPGAKKGPARGSHVLHRLILQGNHEKSSRLKPQGLEH